MWLTSPQRVLRPHPPFISHRGRVRASKQTAERRTVIQIQTAAGCLWWDCETLSFVRMNPPIPFYSHGCLKHTYSILHSSWLQHKFRLLPLCALRMPSTVMTHSCINSFVLMPVGLLNTRSGMWARVFRNGSLVREGWDAHCCCCMHFYVPYICFHAWYFNVPRPYLFYYIYFLCATCALFMFSLFMCTSNLPSWVVAAVIFPYCVLEYKAFSQKLYFSFFHQPITPINS